MDHKPKDPKECVVCEIAIATFIIITYHRIYQFGIFNQ